MQSGKVKWFDNRKGIGFLLGSNGGRDIFVHHSVVQMDGFRTLTEGQPVFYEAEDTPKGPAATVVIPAGGAVRGEDR